jgi:hypothetical protein
VGACETGCFAVLVEGAFSTDGTRGRRLLDELRTADARKEGQRSQGEEADGDTSKSLISMFIITSNESPPESFEAFGGVALLVSGYTPRPRAHDQDAGAVVGFFVVVDGFGLDHLD